MVVMHLTMIHFAHFVLTVIHRLVLLWEAG
jgi:hypothetical protein